MFTAILTIFVVYFLWLVVKPLVARYMRRKFQQKVNDMFRQSFGGQAQGFPFGDAYDAREQGDRQQRQQYSHGRKEKIFSRDEGEYVEFEEVVVKVTEESGSRPSGNAGYTPREPQISDAEWEEIR